MAWWIRRNTGGGATGTFTIVMVIITLLCMMAPAVQSASLNVGRSGSDSLLKWITSTGDSVILERSSDTSYIPTLNGSLTVSGNITGTISITVNGITWTLSQWLTELKARLMIPVASFYSTMIYDPDYYYMHANSGPNALDPYQHTDRYPTPAQIGIVYATYDGSTTYNLDEYVEYSGVIYRSLIQGGKGTDPSNAGHWQYYNVIPQIAQADSNWVGDTGQSFQLLGRQGLYIEGVTISPSVLGDSTTTWTISTWLKVSSGLATCGVIASNEVFHFYWTPNAVSSSLGGMISLTMLNNGAPVTVAITSTAHSPLPDDWFHTAAGFDGTSIYVYVNGIRQSLVYSSPSVYTPTNDDIWIGRLSANITDTAITCRPLIGWMDNTAIWTPGLTDFHVQLLAYNRQDIPLTDAVST